MKGGKSIANPVLATLAIVAVFAMRGIALAHCDTMDGPVVKAARKALDAGNVNYALIWVQPKDEAELRRAFEKSRAVAGFGPEAKQMADRYFFETLVRIHRAGEGAPYSGLRPAGLDLGPAIPAADAALRGGSPEAVTKLLTGAVSKGLKQHFDDVARKRDYKPDDVAAGREYVEAYVQYVHYVERLYEAATKTAHGHYAEADGLEH